MTNTEAIFKGIKTLFEEVLNEGSLYVEDADGIEQETTVDRFIDDWADVDSAGIAVEIDGISYTITIRANK